MTEIVSGKTPGMELTIIAALLYYTRNLLLYQYKVV